MKHALTNLALALVNGFILFFYSERLFWTVWRTGDSVADQIITWLAYSMAAYLFLAALVYFRAKTLWSVSLAGALYGWLVEGTLVPTLYGTEESAPFPLSLCVTGLSWHMLLSVLVGWFGLRRSLASTRWIPTVVVAAGVGIFWGLWATFQWHETPPVITPPAQFFLHSFSLTLLLAVACWINLHIGIHNFRPRPVGLTLSVLVLGLFYTQHVARLGVLPLVVLPSVLALALLPLWRYRSRQVRASPEAGLTLAATTRLSRLLVMPLVATAVYTLAEPMGLARVPISTIVFYWITAPVGTVLFVVAVVKCWIRPSPVPPGRSNPTVI